MSQTVPSQEQALSFYRAALSTARLLDQESEPRVFDADADAAWRAYGSDLPDVIRCDLILRNFAMLYPAAFAPGPVFGLSGWYNDDPWGTGFERPPIEEMHRLFASRKEPSDKSDALSQTLTSWGIETSAGALNDAQLARISPATNIVVCGGRAMATLARVLLHAEHLSLRTQLILVSAEPAPRQTLGVVCALRREAGEPLLVELRRGPDETPAVWATREKKRLALPARAELCVVSADASIAEREAASQLATALGIVDVLEIAAS